MEKTATAGRSSNSEMTTYASLVRLGKNGANKGDTMGKRTEMKLAGLHNDLRLGGDGSFHARC